MSRRMTRQQQKAMFAKNRVRSHSRRKKPQTLEEKLKKLKQTKYGKQIIRVLKTAERKEFPRGEGMFTATRVMERDGYIRPVRKTVSMIDEMGKPIPNKKTNILVGYELTHRGRRLLRGIRQN